MLGITEGLYGNWGAVLLIGAVFCLFGLCAFIADWRTKLELRSELADERAYLRDLAWDAANEGAAFHPATNTLPHVYSNIARLRGELADL